MSNAIQSIVFSSKIKKDILNQNIYAFNVNKKLKKPEIKQICEDIFNTKVISVNTSILPPKKYRPNFKRALVKFEKKKLFNLFENISPYFKSKINQKIKDLQKTKLENSKKNLNKLKKNNQFSKESLDLRIFQKYLDNDASLTNDPYLKRFFLKLFIKEKVENHLKQKSIDFDDWIFLMKNRHNKSLTNLFPVKQGMKLTSSSSLIKQKKKKITASSLYLEKKFLFKPLSQSEKIDFSLLQKTTTLFRILKKNKKKFIKQKIKKKTFPFFSTLVPLYQNLKFRFPLLIKRPIHLRLNVFENPRKKKIITQLPSSKKLKKITNSLNQGQNVPFRSSLKVSTLFKKNKVKKEVQPSPPKEEKKKNWFFKRLKGKITKLRNFEISFPEISSFVKSSLFFGFLSKKKRKSQYKVKLKIKSKPKLKITSKAKLEPKLKSKIQLKLKPKFESKLKQQPVSKPESKPKTKLTSKPKPESKSKSTLESKSKSKFESKLKQEAISKPESKPKIKVKESKSKSELELKTELKSKPKSELKLKQEPESKLKPESKLELEEKPEAEIIEELPSKSKTKPTWLFKTNLTTKEIESLRENLKFKLINIKKFSQSPKKKNNLLFSFCLSAKLKQKLKQKQLFILQKEINKKKEQVTKKLSKKIEKKKSLEKIEKKQPKKKKKLIALIPSFLWPYIIEYGKKKKKTDLLKTIDKKRLLVGINKCNQLFRREKTIKIFNNIKRKTSFGYTFFLVKKKKAASQELVNQSENKIKNWKEKFFKIEEKKKKTTNKNQNKNRQNEVQKEKQPWWKKFVNFFIDVFKSSIKFSVYAIKNFSFKNIFTYFYKIIRSLIYGFKKYILRPIQLNRRTRNLQEQYEKPKKNFVLSKILCFVESLIAQEDIDIYKFMDFEPFFFELAYDIFFLEDDPFLEYFENEIIEFNQLKRKVFFQQINKKIYDNNLSNYNFLRTHSKSIRKLNKRKKGYYYRRDFFTLNRRILENNFFLKVFKLNDSFNEQITVNGRLIKKFSNLPKRKYYDSKFLEYQNHINCKKSFYLKTNNKKFSI